VGAIQSRSSGFCGGYWFGDVTTGAGLVLSLRDGRVAELTAFLDPSVLEKVPLAPMSS